MPVGRSPSSTAVDSFVGGSIEARAPVEAEEEDEPVLPSVATAAAVVTAVAVPSVREEEEAIGSATDDADAVGNDCVLQPMVDSIEVLASSDGSIGSGKTKRHDGVIFGGSGRRGARCGASCRLPVDPVVGGIGADEANEVDDPSLDNSSLIPFAAPATSTQSAPAVAWVLATFGGRRLNGNFEVGWEVGLVILELSGVCEST